MIHGIVTLPPEDTSPHLFKVWNDLITNCEIPAKNLPPIPHITWHVADTYDLEQVNTLLMGLAQKTKPIQVRAIGLGIFTGTAPVIYLTVIKNLSCARLHNKLWKLVTPHAHGSSSFYAPNNWIPHITLAYGDISNEQIGCTLERLVYRPIDFYFVIDHFLIGYLKEDNSWGAIQRFSFQDKSQESNRHG